MESEVTIRRAREGDARLLWAWQQMPEVQRYQPLEPATPSQISRGLRRYAAASLSEERGHTLRWIIEEDGTPAGWVTLKNLSWSHRTGTIGYTVAPWAQRRGVGLRGVSQVLDLAFGPGRLERVEADCDIENEASWRLMEKLGFQREGTLRSLVRIGSRRRDFYLYSILRDEWLQQKKEPQAGEGPGLLAPAASERAAAAAVEAETAGEQGEQDKDHAQQREPHEQEHDADQEK